jgi:alpha-glucosidase
VWTASNHDVSRFPTRWCGGDERRARLALLILLTLRGTPFLYYGDEIGMLDVEVPTSRATDPLVHRFPGQRRGRDPERTPMQWADRPGGGFTAPGVEPWLPLGDLARNVEDQRRDPASALTLGRDLIALRRLTPDLHRGPYTTLPAPAGAWAWRRGERTQVAVNLSDDEVVIGGLDGRVLIATDRARDGEAVAGELRLRPWEGAVISRG